MSVSASGMKVVYYTSGTTGSGRIVRGISIGNSFRRKATKVDFSIVSSSSFAYLADVFNIPHYEIPAETEDKLGKDSYANSELFRTLLRLKPDVLLIDLLWFPVYHFLDNLPCRSVFLWERLDERFFTIPLPGGAISYRPEKFDLVLAIEPFKGEGPEKQVNPLIIRNRDEIFSRDQAVQKLRLNPSKKSCLISIGGQPGDFERVMKEYCYLEDAGYQLVPTTYGKGLFPVVDYFNAFDLVICGAGYNSFWEAIFFEKEAIFIPTKASFVSGERLIEEYQDYTFSENGADQLVDIVLAI